jgi:hypothetical protein
MSFEFCLDAGQAGGCASRSIRAGLNITSGDGLVARATIRILRRKQ